jgi:hypothetical protein
MPIDPHHHHASGKQFDVRGAILKAVSGLLVNLAIDSNVKLDDCKFDRMLTDSELTGRQMLHHSPSTSSVFQLLYDDSPTKLCQCNILLNFLQVDDTVLYLIGAVAAPIAQSLVDGATLMFTEANITSASLRVWKGAYQSDSEFDAEICRTTAVIFHCLDL